MKLRIILKNKEYYCQRRYLFFWKNLQHWHQFIAGGGYFRPTSFNSDSKAIEWMNRYIEIVNNERTSSKVIKEYTV